MNNSKKNTLLKRIRQEEPTSKMEQNSLKYLADVYNNPQSVYFNPKTQANAVSASPNMKFSVPKTRSPPLL